MDPTKLSPRHCSVNLTGGGFTGGNTPDIHCPVGRASPSAEARAPVSQWPTTMRWRQTNEQTYRQTDRQRHRVKPSVLRRKVNDVHWYVTMIVGLCAQTQHHCYYTGSVRGPTYSTAAFSTCHGIVLVSFPQSSHPVILTHMPHVFYLYFA